MEFHCHSSALRGTVAIPGSKSHTIRGVLLASLADGESVLTAPLASNDTAAAVDVYRALGAEFELGDNAWRIRGVGGEPQTPVEVLDVGNSGTTLRVAMGSCALLREGKATLTGDEQIRRRPGGPLAGALTDLGATVTCLGKDGRPPFEVGGRLSGGQAEFAAPTSQFLTSLLLCCPLADGDSDLRVTLLHEKPYVQLTLDWLDHLRIAYERDGWRHFHVPGGQRFPAFERRIPADWSSATFFLVAGALGDNRITCEGLDLDDSQSDKQVLDFLRRMGADVQVDGDSVTVSSRGGLEGTELDLNDCPDSLPMMATAACFASGTTRLVNVPQARLKETDRIAVMAAELGRLGAAVEELEDGLVIHGDCPLRGGTVDGHADHRVVMALTVAGTRLAEPLVVRQAQAASVTYPGFLLSLQALGGDVQKTVD